MTTILLIKIKTEIETRGPYWSQCYSNHLSRRQGCSEEPKCIQVLRPRPYQPRLLREGADILDKPLSVVFFSSIDKCYFPSLWKGGKVTPIRKKDDKSVASNYRPITLLSPVGKTIERCVHITL